MCLPVPLLWCAYASCHQGAQGGSVGLLQYDRRAMAGRTPHESAREGKEKPLKGFRKSTQCPRDTTNSLSQGLQSMAPLQGWKWAAKRGLLPDERSSPDMFRLCFPKGSSIEAHLASLCGQLACSKLLGLAWKRITHTPVVQVTSKPEP